MSPITSHVLDTTKGKPAAGIRLQLLHLAENTREIGRDVTNGDGRATRLLPDDYELAPGFYQLIFETAAYFEYQGSESFYPVVTITFEVANPTEHYHVPLLLSPFGYSTYRGS